MASQSTGYGTRARPSGVGTRILSAMASRVRGMRARPQSDPDDRYADSLENAIKYDVIDHLAAEHVMVDKDWLDY